MDETLAVALTVTGDSGYPLELWLLTLLGNPTAVLRWRTTAPTARRVVWWSAVSAC